MLAWFKKKLNKNEQPVDSPAVSTAPLDEDGAPSEKRDVAVETSKERPLTEEEQPLSKENDEISAAVPDCDEDSPAEQDRVLGHQSDESSVTEKAAPEAAPEDEREHTSQNGEEKVFGEEPVSSSEKKKKGSFLNKLADRLVRTRESFTYQLDTIFLGKKEIDAELLDDLEEVLITADLGVATSEEILEHARRRVKRENLSDPKALKIAIQEKIASLIAAYQEDAALVQPAEGPFVIMVVGVNGVGKTTTIGKIAHKFATAEQSVLLVAADTFRAAAIAQLKIWGERVNAAVISQNEGADPSSVVFDAISHARAKKYDVVLVDTAGRLHTQANLMEELKKIKRVIGKQYPGAPHEVLLIVDATTGQNGISQAKLFNEAVGVTGIALTKLDGTAKGGIVTSICRELQTPIRFIGVGEQMDDLRDFDTDEFIAALFQGPKTGADQ